MLHLEPARVVVESAYTLELMTDSCSRREEVERENSAREPLKIVERVVVERGLLSQKGLDCTAAAAVGLNRSLRTELAERKIDLLLLHFEPIDLLLPLVIHSVVARTSQRDSNDLLLLPVVLHLAVD